MSGTIYIATPPGTGRLYFRDPRRAFEGSEELTEANAFQGVEVSLMPQPGLVAIFPPWVTHHVEPTSGSEARVAISFNLRGNWSKSIHASARAMGVISTGREDHLFTGPT